jgi:hypothetical protein
MRDSDLCSIGPPTKDGYALDAAHFREALLTEWPAATVRQDEQELSPMHFRGEIPIAEDRITFGFAKSGQVLLLENGSIPGYAVVACWFRRLVPPEYRLLLHDESFYFEVELRPDTTEEVLIAAMREDS